MSLENNNVNVLYPDYQPAPFSEKFFLVVIEKDLNRNSVLQMWHLHLKSVQACVGECRVPSASLNLLCLRCRPALIFPRVCLQMSAAQIAASRAS